MVIDLRIYIWSIERHGLLTLTLYALTGRIRPALPKFQFYNKKGSSKKFAMSVAPMSR